MQAIISNLKTENESLFNSIKQKKYEDFSNYSEKLKPRNTGSTRNYSVLSAILNMVIKLKAKYTEEIIKLRYSLENLNAQHDSNTILTLS